MPSAFPGASGWGANSVGGRGGTIIQVTNTNDSGAGSLRTALTTAGARIVVFTVSGLIDLLTTITVSNPYLTIAGQTAPGSGIVLQGEDIRLTTHNVIIRYLRWRMGAGDTNPLVIRGGSAEGAHDIMLDHLSFAWQEDDAISLGPDVTGQPVYNFTLQNSLFTEPEPATGGTSVLADGSLDGAPDYLYQGSVHNNLFSQARVRQPNFRGRSLESINNVVYNWTGDVGEFLQLWDESQGSEIDYINNYWSRGTTGMPGNEIIKYDTRDATDGDDPLCSIYVAGNYAPHISLTDPEVDNWPVVYLIDGLGGEKRPSTDHQRLTQLSQPTYPVPLVAATVAQPRVLVEAGACRRINADGTWTRNRDSVDDRAVDAAENDNGYSSMPTVPLTMPDVDSGTAYTDTDGDGMADDYEDNNGLDKNSALDGDDVAGNGFTNVENFLNGIPILELGGPGGL